VILPLHSLHNIFLVNMWVNIALFRYILLFVLSGFTTAFSAL